MSDRNNSSPWRYAEAERNSTEVVRISAAQPEDFVPPQAYGSYEFPKADTAYPVINEYSDPIVRKVSDVVILPNHVVVDATHNEVTPYTFMRNRRYHHGGVQLQEDGSYKSKYNVSKLPVLHCDHPIYHADTDHPDVYGHVLLEVIPSLWAVDLIQEKSLKVATSIKLGAGYTSMFRALGISEERITLLRGATYAPEVYLPSKVVQRRRYIDPMARVVFNRLRDMLAWRSDMRSYERVYISRSKVPGRKLINETEVEALFSALGFLIVHPQELSIFDQVKLFSEAKLIAGSGGSAMHNTLFSRSDSKVLIVSSIGWVVVADALICQQPNQLGYVFGSPPEMPNDTHRTQADWSVDLKEVREAIRLHFDI